MDAILTHDNADFDAVAALLGAKKVYADALAILPPRLNRNVREFCALYADALPFTRPDDLPRRKFSHVVIVDTQSIASARGVHPETKIHFVDHHPLTRELKQGMTFCGGDVGATTTLFVEEIREKDLPLTMIEATLLLLGVYEDTGSLSYSTTTARDARTAAFLLERGATLADATHFLHHPLNDAQRKLYQKLLERLEMVDIAGHPIAIAAARTRGYVEEVSTLAHQLRELYDPAALFLFVQMEDHIQMVARSERAAIDVSAIAEEFGGGGHDKAAAALIREKDLRKAKTKLLKLLKATVRPSVTVREVMSFGTHTLEPTATVAQAAEMMNRYGHEGFPVVRKSKLTGIVTRREIDRAMHHKLGNTPIKNLMRKPVSVSPDDSLDVVRDVMIQADVGQVPVVNAKRRGILGIVTRTDVIKQSRGARPSRAQDIAERLEKWLPPELLTLVRSASQTARELGFSVYLVGGFVRDLLLNQPNLDLDLVVEGDVTLAPHASPKGSVESAGVLLARTLAKKFGGRVHGHARFGTAKWMIEGANEHGGTGAEEQKRSPARLPTRPLAHYVSLDFTTARTEFYAHPSALPEVERSSIKQDLHRRDFTINTLAICLAPERFGQLLDPFGGEDDLRAGWIRVLHNLSFVEDPTRILRAVRLEQRLGFKIEARTAELIGDALAMIHRVSGERIRTELSLIFQETEPAKAMARLAELGALRAIDPHLSFDAWRAEKIQTARGAGDLPAMTFFCLLAYALSTEQADGLATRLQFSNAERETMRQVLALREQASALMASHLAPSAVVHLLEGYSDDALAIFHFATDDARVRERVELYRTRWREISSELGGEDLKKMGIRPGPIYREILTRLRDARLDDLVKNRAEEERIVSEMVEGKQGNK